MSGHKVLTNAPAAQEDIDCPVCLDPITSRMQPCILPACQHTFCLECLKMLKLYIDNTDKGFRCPVCRHFYPDSLRVDRLPVDLSRRMRSISLGSSEAMGKQKKGSKKEKGKERKRRESEPSRGTSIRDFSNADLTRAYYMES